MEEEEPVNVTVNFDIAGLIAAVEAQTAALEDKIEALNRALTGVEITSNSTSATGSHDLAIALSTLTANGSIITDISKSGTIYNNEDPDFDELQEWEITYQNESTAQTSIAELLNEQTTALNEQTTALNEQTTALNEQTIVLNGDLKNIAIINEYWHQVSQGIVKSVNSKLDLSEIESAVDSPVVSSHDSSVTSLTT